LSVARWGLVPAWAKDPRGGARMINARAETVASSNAFARSFARRRCLVPADGWYEWVRRGTGKQAYFMTPRDGGVLAFAGVWSSWSAPGQALLTCGIITTAAVGDLALVHQRMPLLLPSRSWSAWLTDPAEAGELLIGPTEEELAGIEIRPVGPGVGNVHNDGPELIEMVPAPPLAAPPTEAVTLTLF
jgi:putative SOS response-associated peptidase YedK